MLSNGLSSLYLLLNDLSVQGIPLWTIETDLLGITLGQPVVSTPQGTVDILNINVRNMARVTGTYSSTTGTADNAFDGDVETVCTESAPAGSITLDTGATGTAYVTTVGLLPGATATWSISLEFSDDNVSYTQYYSDTALSVTDRTWVWLDFNTISSTHRYWRITGGAATTLILRELYYGNTPNDILMGVLNRDNYFLLPNKTFRGLPLQYWLDKQDDVPLVRMWPAPDTASQFRVLVIQRQRYVEDVGTLQQTIEVPQRWYDAVIWALAEILAIETKEVETDKVLPAIQKMKDKAWAQAWAAEHTADPLQIQPDISIYTRC